MKFKITMKDPDGVYESVRDAVAASVLSIPGCNADEKAAIAQHRQDVTDAAIRKWFQYGEYVEIEVDTDAGTAVVVPCK